MKHLVIPDCQVKPGNDLSYLKSIGNYIVDKRPDVIINIGDFADMPSLSSYDKGKKSFEGRRYKMDIEATHAGMEALLGPIKALQKAQRERKEKQYKPRMILTLGNHEERILRAINNDAMLDGTIGIEDLRYKEYGWEVHDFLHPVVVDGVVYCHYLVSGAMGRPIGTASAILAKRHQSAVVGHQQGLQIATANKADGQVLTAIIAGSCYEHEEEYMGPQGNQHWRGILMLHDVRDGEFDLMPVSLKYLKEREKRK